MESGFLELVIKQLASQGPYALVLGGLSWCFVKFWIVPKAAADVEKTRSDQIATLDQAAAMKLIASAVDKMASEHHAHRNEHRQLVSLVSEITDALMAGDHVSAKTSLKALRVLFISDGRSVG